MFFFLQVNLQLSRQTPQLSWQLIIIYFGLLMQSPLFAMTAQSSFKSRQSVKKNQLELLELVNCV